MEAVNEFVDVIRDIYQQEQAFKDSTVLCQIVGESEDGVRYNVCVIPDTSTVLYGIPNETPYTFRNGDFCYVYKLNNQLSNAFICHKVIVTNSPEQFRSLPREFVLTSLESKEDVENKTQGISADSTTEEYPSARAVYLALQDLLAQINNETTIYLVSAETNPFLKSTDITITLYDSFQDTSGNYITVDELNVGDTLYVIEEEWPNRWVQDFGEGTATLYKEKQASSGIQDLTLNGLSVVTDGVGALTLGPGLASPAVGQIQLSIGALNTLSPSLSSLTISQQSQYKLYIENSSGEGYKIPPTDLGYTRMKVTDTDDRDIIDVNDFLFVKQQQQ